MEPEVRRDEAKPEEWSPEVQDGRRQTKAEPERRGSPAELVDHGGKEGAWSHGGVDGSTCRDGDHASEAGGGVEGNSDHGDAGGDVAAGSHTLTDVISNSGSAEILNSVATCGDGSLVAAGSGSPSAVGSGMRSCTAGRWWAGHWVRSGTGVSTPQRRRNSLKDHLRTTALCTRCLY